MSSPDQYAPNPKPAGAEKSQDPTAVADGSPDLWHLIQRWLRKLGLLGLVVLACASIYWNWDHISRLPGIAPLVAQLTERALPKSVPGKFNIAVTRLEGDDGRETERLIRESLAEFPSVTTLSVDRLIASEHGDSEQAERAGHENARAARGVRR